MIIYIDIDNTICYTNGMNYEDSTPIVDNIEKANLLFDEGHTIVYWTARGSVTKKNWKKLTMDQLNKWNVKYHKLVFKKPPFDLLIDDKVLNTRDWI